MKLHNSIGPNPQVVRMFMAERGIELDTVEVDVRAGENRRAPYITQVNPAGQCPALVLDNGDAISEITAICEYLDEVSPGPSLIGETPEERGETRMWVRRLDLNVVEPLLDGFRFGGGLEFFKPRIFTIPEAADGLKAKAQERLEWLDGLMAGKTWIAGESFTLADVMLYCFLEFAERTGQAPNPELKNIAAWQTRIRERPSTKA